MCVPAQQPAIGTKIPRFLLARFRLAATEQLRYIESHPSAGTYLVGVEQARLSTDVGLHNKAGLKAGLLSSICYAKRPVHLRCSCCGTLI